ncbi:MAG: cytochrome C [Nitrospiraceae bacterium]|nr:cytochrome C [Nitrospiraceae bacterium]
MSEKKTPWQAALVALFARNWIALFGAVLSAVSALLIGVFVIIGLLQLSDSPYMGIMAFMVLPGVFVFGLLAIPAGALWERYKTARPGAEAPSDRAAGLFPVIDLNSPHTRRMAGIVIVLTVLNLLIISTVSYQGVKFMESVQFCGKVCHTVMEPEYAAYAASPHSRVACVECHIGPGAPWFVRSKLSGLGQVLAVTFDTYEKPIPTPVRNLRPSQDTCEQCHWPEKFTGDRVKVITKFLDDEANTPTKTVLLMHIGGGSASHGGIHSWHINPSIRTTYIAADEQRQEIAHVRVEKADGSVLEFTNTKASTDGHDGEERVMDCIDCHNRPTHIFQTPMQAVDGALASKRIDTALPYIKKLGVEVLTETAEAQRDSDQILERVRAYYEENYPDLYASGRETVESAASVLKALYDRNVFPKMGVTWGTYGNNLGHETSTGCFRCHNDELVTAEGEAIGGDCDVCHTVLAWDEEDPEILDQLQIQ